MILFVTTSPNDDDLAKVLGSSAIRCPVPSDVCFWGRGEGGTVLRVACERKKTGDLAQCIYNGRLLYQAQVAKENGIDVFCLIVEGRVRSSPDDGLLEVPVWGINPRTMHRAEIWTPVKPTITYSRFDQYLTELDYLAGIIVKRSFDVKETAAIIKALWDNFQTPPERHQSLKQMFKPAPPTVQLVRPSLTRRIASELDGIGWERSGAVAQYFKSVTEMVNAGVEEWENIVTIDDKDKSRRLGRRVAEKVVAQIRGGVFI